MLCQECNNELKPNCKRFCSKQCCIKGIAKTNRKPRPSCKYCGNIVTELINKFCNQSCAAKFNNEKRKKNNIKIGGRPSKNHYCKKCNKLTSTKWTSKKYCTDCQNVHNPNFVDWSTITLKEFKSKFPNIFQMNARIRDLSRREYKRSNKPKHCVNCGYSKFYEVCHIKPIKLFQNDDTINIINSIHNLVALCPNCHWELDHNLLEF